MANIKSAEKRIRINRLKAAINKSRKSEIKTYTRRFLLAIDKGSIEEAKELLKMIDRKLKRAAHKNTIHKNAAARKISNLTKKLNKKINEAM